MKKLLVAVCCYSLLNSLSAQKVRLTYVNEFDNTNHPEVAYWFIASNMLPREVYRRKIDSLAQYSKYTLIFLTQRNGCDFSDVKTMHPVFADIVGYAHQKGLRIGLQLFKSEKGTLAENTDRLIQEGEVALDAGGKATYRVTAKSARNAKELFRSELFCVYAFKKTADGFYDPATLQVITPKSQASADTSHVNVTINAGASLAGYTAYILTQHYYNSCSNFSTQSVTLLKEAFAPYADIPFDGVALDEYKNLRLAKPDVLAAKKQLFRERLYSLGMKQKMKEKTGADLDKLLFDMRYAPTGRPELRIRAINEYMSLLRTGTLEVESNLYELGKRLYGKNAFIGVHSTFHNNLDEDEVWQTGISWWNIKRDYGHTDEETPTPIQLGIGMSNPENAMYNMYYNKSAERIWTKALYDLRFGIRTHYHAANDVQGWGVSIDAPGVLPFINKVENAARMLNRFNPRFPNVKLLVVYGMESLCNWYPDSSKRGVYDMNTGLAMDKKSVELWENGYLHAAVPTDEIEDGRIKLNAAGKPVLNGYVFDAVVFLAPEYAKPSTVSFLREYVNKGGKLLLDGIATRDFYGNPVGDEWKQVSVKAVAHSYSLENIAKLGIAKNALVDGVANGNGVYTFTNAASIKTNEPAVFSFSDHGNRFSGTYRGVVVIRVSPNGDVMKLSASSFGSLSKNGKKIFSLTQPSDLFLETKDGIVNVTVADKSGSVKLLVNQ